MLAARHIDPAALKSAWLEMAARAEAEIERVANEQPYLEIGVAFVDERGEPGWIDRDPKLKIHHPTVGGCWPRFVDADIE